MIKRRDTHDYEHEEKIIEAKVKGNFFEGGMVEVNMKDDRN